MQNSKTISVFKLVAFFVCNTITNSNALVGYNILPARGQRFSSVVCLTKNETYLSQHNEISVICTGTLITNQHVLTAAHCFGNVVQSRVHVILGSAELRRGTKYSIMWWLTYNQWSDSMRMRLRYPSNDIGITKLLEDTPGRIVPAPLSMMQSRSLHGLAVRTVGCGISNTGTFPEIIETAALRVIKKSRCEAIGAALTGIHEIIEDRYICTTASPYTLLHSGDSGGPLFYKNDILGINVGNFPSLNGSFNEHKANYHISIENYRYFIDNVMLM